MEQSIFWYGLIFLVGLAGFPFSFFLFSRLPDRGYTFSRPFGLLLVSLAAWWIGNLNLLSFDQFTCWLSLGLVALVGYFGLLTGPRRAVFLAWFKSRPNLKMILAAEILFFCAFAFMVNARSFYVDWHPVTEKFFNQSFINALINTTTFPPPDPWFEGRPMNYYYGGHLLIAVICKMAGTGANVGYNLGMGLVFASSALTCFGLVYNLAALGSTRLEKKPSPERFSRKSPLNLHPLLAGLSGAIFLMALGNLDPLRQIIRQGIGASPKSFPFEFDWYKTSRLIFDRMPGGKTETLLTDFPISSYLKGDLHAFQQSIPFDIMVLALGLQILIFPSAWSLGGQSLSGLARLPLTGLLVGSLNFINAVDYPTFFGILGIFLVLGEIRSGGERLAVVGRIGFQMAALVVSSWLIYFFYLNSFTGMLKAEPSKGVEYLPGIGFLSRFIGFVSWPRTNLSEYLWMFGLFLFPVVTFLGLKLRQLWSNEPEKLKNSRSSRVKNLPRYAGLFLLITGGLGLLNFYLEFSRNNGNFKDGSLPLITLPVALIILWPRGWATLKAHPRWALEGFYFLAFTALGPHLQFELLGPLEALTYYSLRLANVEFKKGWQKDEKLPPLDFYILFLVGLGGAITLFCELLYVRDVYSNRYNTIFKYWYQVWFLFGLAASFATWRAITWPWPARKGGIIHRAANFLRDRAGKLSPESFFRSESQFAGEIPENPGLNFFDKGSLNKDNQLTPSISPAFAGHTSREVKARETGFNLTSFSFFKLAWLSGLVFLVLVGLLLPTYGYWAENNHYGQRVGLTGESWYEREYPNEYPALVWFRNYLAGNPARRGIELEANPMNYTWGGRISVYTGLPTIVGWPFHELQWRGYLNEAEIWQPWVDMDKIYETTDRSVARSLIEKYKVRYVFVGQIENGSHYNSPYDKQYRHYSTDALAKFKDFMTPIYSDPVNNIFIYALNPD